MKVAYVASVIALPHRDGTGAGGSTHALAVSRELERLGHRVVVLCGRFSGEELRGSLDGVEIRRLFRWDGALWRAAGGKAALWKVLRAPYHLGRTLRHAFALCRLLRADATDIVYERASRSTLAGAAAAWLRGLPFVLELNDESYHGLSLRVARAIVTPNAEMVPEPFRSKVVELDWGVDTDRFRPDVESDWVKANHALPEGKTAVFLGSGLAWHGLEVILEAARGVVREIPEAAFLILAGGRARQECEERVREAGLERNFRFAGRVPHDDVPAYLAAADVALAPYTDALGNGGRHKFASPLKVLEYMACGKAIVVSEVGNYKAFIQPEVSGVVIPRAEPEALAEAVVRLMRSPESRERMGREARRRAEERYSWREHGRALEKLFDDKLAKGSR